MLRSPWRGPPARSEGGEAPSRSQDVDVAGEVNAAATASGRVVVGGEVLRGRRPHLVVGVGRRVILIVGSGRATWQRCDVASSGGPYPVWPCAAGFVIVMSPGFQTKRSAALAASSVAVASWAAALSFSAPSGSTSVTS
jgi:hypothetical protein